MLHQDYAVMQPLVHVRRCLCGQLMQADEQDILGQQAFPQARAIASKLRMAVVPTMAGGCRAWPDSTRVASRPLRSSLPAGDRGSSGTKYTSKGAPRVRGAVAATSCA